MPGRESEWFRYACVTVVAAVCLPPIAEALAVLSSKLPAGHRHIGEALVGLVVSGAVALLVTTVFAWACWVVTRPRETPGPGVHILLGLQLLGCAGLTVELVHLVSVQVGATLPWRAAWRWQPAVTDRVRRVLQSQPPPFESPGALDGLTRRETEILRLMAGGFSNREIADAFKMTEGTVRNHGSAIFSKLGVRDRTRAVLKGIELGII